jgi:endogenous inhibitor of DNA gyrase (YacG/DUF329 family)
MPAMPGYPCPTCGRALKLGDELLGALVQCPMCGTEFQAPEEPPPPRPAPPRPLMTWAVRTSERPPPELPGPAGDSLGPRGAADLRSAATWLQVAVILQGISGLLCCCGPAFEGAREVLVVTGPLTVVLKYVPLLFAVAAAFRLPTQRRPALCRAGAILLIWTSLWGALEALIGIASMVSDHRKHWSPSAMVGLVCTLAGVPGVVCGIVGSIKTLTVLARPEIARTFH